MVFEQLSQAIVQQVNITGPNVTMPVLPPITLANAFGDVVSVLILITLMAGITIRTYSEYIGKLISGEIAKFDRKYFVTALIAFFTSLPIAMALMPEGVKMFLAYFGQWGILGALIMVGLYGYGWNHATNKLTKLVESRTSNQQQPEPTPNSTETNPPPTP